MNSNTAASSNNNRLNNHTHVDASSVKDEYTHVNISKHVTGSIQLWDIQSGNNKIVVVRKSSGELSAQLCQPDGTASFLVLKGIPSHLKLEDIPEVKSILSRSTFQLNDNQLEFSSSPKSDIQNTSSTTKETQKSLEPLEDLPAELVQAITQHLSKQDITALSSVSKQSKINIHTITQALDFSTHSSSSKEVLLEGLKGWNNQNTIRSINLSNCTCVDTDIVDYIVENFSNLKTLTLSHCSQLRDNNLASLSKIHTLTHLDLTKSFNLTDQVLSYVKECRNLEYLILANCRKLTGQALAYLKDLGNLKYLDLADCDQLTDQALVHIKYLSNLEHLSLADCRKLTDQALVHIKDLSNLEYLSLDRCYKLTDQALMHVKDFSNLKHLDLVHCDQLTDQALVYVKDLRNLEHLDLADCYKLTDQSLVHIQNLINLLELNLKGCSRLTQSGITLLKNQLPNVKIINKAVVNYLAHI